MPGASMRPCPELVLVASCHSYSSSHNGQQIWADHPYRDAIALQHNSLQVRAGPNAYRQCCDLIARSHQDGQLGEFQHHLGSRRQ
eukprot:1159303-Pelagomonas_calceolata.AAC.8